MQYGGVGPPLVIALELPIIAKECAHSALLESKRRYWEGDTGLGYVLNLGRFWTHNSIVC
jgi:hypothetical protein